MDPAQLLLFEKVLDQIAPRTITAPVEPAAAESQTPESPKLSTNGHGRRQIPADAPRQKVVFGRHAKKYI